MEDVNKRRLNFLSLSELEYGSTRVRLHLTKLIMSWRNRDDIERTQIHFFDVVVTIAVVVS